VFDASASTDAEDPLSSLVVRWDWDGDGVWDASSATSATAAHVFATAGTWPVTCEVEDTGGLTSRASTSVSVASARLRFVAMGDSRGSTEAEPVNTPALGAIVQDILALDPPPSFVLFCGDLVVSGGTAQLDVWKQTMAPLGAAGILIYPVPGNHDIGSVPSLQAEYQAAFDLPTTGPAGYDELCYSFSAGPAVFVALDSDYNDGTSTLAHRITPEQRAWLPGALSPARSQPIRHLFVFTHDPAYPAGPHVGSSLDAYPTERDAFWQILVDGRATAFFAGHEHLYARRTIDSSVNAAWTTPVTELIVGTCGAPISPSPTETCDAWAPAYHFCVADLDGRVAVFTVYGSAMDVIDTFTLSR
jgi:PKD repeat protein